MPPPPSSSHAAASCGTLGHRPFGKCFRFDAEGITEVAHGAFFSSAPPGFSMHIKIAASDTKVLEGVRSAVEILDANSPHCLTPFFPPFSRLPQSDQPFKCCRERTVVFQCWSCSLDKSL